MQQSNFGNFSKDWWDEKGPMKMLHSMNQTRMLFIKERISNRYETLGDYKDVIKKKKILDLGCGGGILSEALAKEGARIKAIDTSFKLIKEAKKRAASKGYNISYENCDINKIFKRKEKFDIILSLEVIEHVSDINAFLNTTFNCLNKNGLIIFSTINRSLISYFSTIFLAEKILGLVPKNTHDWKSYVKPKEIILAAKKFNIKLDKVEGLLPIPLISAIDWIRIKNVKANYILSLKN